MIVSNHLVFFSYFSSTFTIVMTESGSFTNVKRTMTHAIKQTMIPKTMNWTSPLITHPLTHKAPNTNVAMPRTIVMIAGNKTEFVFFT